MKAGGHPEANKGVAELGTPSHSASVLAMCLDWQLTQIMIQHHLSSDSPTKSVAVAVEKAWLTVAKVHTVFAKLHPLNVVAQQAHCRRRL
eukprot:12421474-Karenia_brevis.AAC.1